MANLYPLRATEPQDLPVEHNARLLRRNILEIVDSFGDEPPVMWAAWGVNISSRPYLLKACVRLHQEVVRFGCTTVSCASTVIPGTLLDFLINGLLPILIWQLTLQSLRN